MRDRFPFPLADSGARGRRKDLSCTLRSHDDLDLGHRFRGLGAVLSALEDEGLLLTEDEQPTRFVVADEHGDRIDFHTVVFDAEGGGTQLLQDGRVYRYSPEGLSGTGVIIDRAVHCLSAAAQVECHLGYQPAETDFADMRLLADHFGLELPPPYRVKGGSRAG